MNQSEAQAKYKEFRDKIAATERPEIIGMAAVIERVKLKNDLNHFRLQCADEGITLLEACPFCGSYNVELVHHVRHEEFVNCNECAVEGPPANSPSLAIAAWNTRVN